MIPSLKQLARDKVANTLSANTHLVFAAPNAPQELRPYHDFILREQKKRSGHSLPAAASPGPEHQADGGTAQPARRAAAAKRSRGQSAAPPAGTPSPPGPTATLLRSPTTEARPAALPCAMARRGRAAPGAPSEGKAAPGPQLPPPPRRARNTTKPLHCPPRAVPAIPPEGWGLPGRPLPLPLTFQPLHGASRPPAPNPAPLRRRCCGNAATSRPANIRRSHWAAGAGGTALTAPQGRAAGLRVGRPAAFR